MILGIAIPLKAKCVAKDWDTTCRLLQRTVDSAINQTSPCFQIVVCGHDKPIFLDAEKYSSVVFKRYTDTPPPTGDKSIEAGYLQFEFDRCNKIHRGLETLNNLNDDITHWFALDGDDLMRCDFVEVLSQYKDYDAVIIDNGYQLDSNRSMVTKCDSFSQWCGSSSVIARKIFEIPKSIEIPYCYDVPFRKFSHVAMLECLRESGFSVAVAKERLMIYVVNHNGNLSDGAYYNNGFIKKLRGWLGIYLKRFGQISGQEKDILEEQFGLK